jgi:hypothetical protein
MSDDVSFDYSVDIPGKTIMICGKLPEDQRNNYRDDKSGDETQI